jgi:ABC-type transporter Mla subunit MlaD
MIAAWRRANAGVEDVAWVRFSDFAKERGASLIVESDTGVDLFSGLEATLAQAKSYELLMNRIFYISKRAPTLIGWQSQAAVDAMLARQEIRDALANLGRSSQAASDAAATAARLADDLPALVQSEREAIFAELDRRQAELDTTLATVNAIAADARAATADVKATLEGVTPLLESAAPTLEAVQRLAETGERILAKVAEIKGPPLPPDPDAPPAKPVTVDDLKETLAAATVTLEQANALLERGESLGESPAIKGLIDEVTHATEQRIASLEESVARLLWLAAGLAAAVVTLVFVLVMVARTAGRATRSSGGAA